MNRSTRRAFLRDLARLGVSITGLAALACCAPTTPATSPARVYRVGVLPIPAGGDVRPAFWARLEELGYVDGQNLVKVVGTGEDAPMELVPLPVDVIVAGSALYIEAAIAATTSIPIVMVGAIPDPVGSGFVASLARPGGNVTGVVANTSDLDGKRLQQLVEAAPTVLKVGVLDSPASSREPLQAAAQALGVALVFESFPTSDDLDAAFEHVVAEGAGALLVRAGAVTNVSSDLIIELAERHRLPVSYPTLFSSGLAG